MRVLQTPAIHRNALFLPYKEEVAGSNPASPTQKKCCFAGKAQTRDRGPSARLGPVRSNAAEVHGEKREAVGRELAEEDSPDREELANLSL